MALTPGLGSFLGAVQIFFAIVIGIYFWNLLRSQQGNKVAVGASRARTGQCVSYGYFA